MQHTIIVADKSAYKNFMPIYGLDVSQVPVDVHALQFNTETGLGHIEFVNSVKQNEEITSLPDWAITVFDEYDAKKLAFEIAQAEAAAAAAAAAQTSTDNMETL